MNITSSDLDLPISTPDCKQVKTNRLVDQVLHQLQTSIIKGDIAPGSKINEQEVAKKYAISRGPAREALQALELQRLVVRSPHIGARVAKLSIDELNDLYALRSVLESMACELAAKKITAQQLSQLTLTLDKQQAELENKDPYFQQQNDIDFHYQIIQASGNTHLQDFLISGIYQLLRMYRYQTSQHHSPDNAIAEHQQILAAISAGDGELAAILMRRHIEKGRVNTELKLNALQSKGEFTNVI